MGRKPSVTIGGKPETYVDIYIQKIEEGSHREKRTIHIKATDNVDEVFELLVPFLKDNFEKKGESE